MDASKRLRQHFSSLYDGEMAASEVELAYAKLNGVEERALIKPPPI